jgi:hypothetical protein
MMFPLRRTTAHLHLSFGDGQAGEGLIGRRFMLEVQGNALTVHVDLTPNFQPRNRHAGSYLDASALVRNHDRLRSLQCDDNLVRTRLVRTWKEMQEPQLRLVLDLGPKGHYAYAVTPHLLFTGGVQLDVLAVLDPARFTPVRAELAQ